MAWRASMTWTLGLSGRKWQAFRRPIQEHGLRWPSGAKPLLFCRVGAGRGHGDFDSGGSRAADAATKVSNRKKRKTRKEPLCAQTARIWSAVTCHRFSALATCRQSRAVSSGPRELDAFPHSTATRRLPKARTSPRTPKLRPCRAGRNVGWNCAQCG